MKWIRILIVVLMPAVASMSLSASELTVRELHRVIVPEAHQAVAVDATSFYAIANRTIARYEKGSSKRLAHWTAPARSEILHLNSGIVIDGRLYCANSNWPKTPLKNSVEVFDAVALKHVESIPFSESKGAINWIERHRGAWWIVFAFYGDAEVRRTKLIRYDDQWNRTGEWSFPESVIQRFLPNSNSGGAFGPNGRLFVTGHDHAELYVLDVPGDGGELSHVATVAAPIAGQGIAWDRSDIGTLMGIVRSRREVVTMRRFDTDETKRLQQPVEWARGNESAANEPSADENERFTQAAGRSFKAFDPAREQTWQRPFFFMQLADTQYGMFTGNKGFEQEAALVQQAVQHINRLRPRFVIVCGDLTNATPEHARYRAQVAQYHQDFSKVDDEIPLVCVCGNHDIGNRPTPKSIATYQENFGDDYFSFWVGGVCNIVLNSSVLKDPTGAPEVLAAQQSWLEQQLRDANTKNAKHILLFQHHPLFLAKEDESDQYFNIPLKRRTPLLDHLKQANVRAVFAGHYHRNAYGRAGDMEMVTTGPVGRPLGKDPSGFRIVTVYETKLQHKYWAMDDVPEKVSLATSSDVP